MTTSRPPLGSRTTSDPVAPAAAGVVGVPEGWGRAPVHGGTTTVRTLLPAGTMIWDCAPICSIGLAAVVDAHRQHERRSGQVPASAVTAVLPSDAVGHEHGLGLAAA